jgi:hypothetical protein
VADRTDVIAPTYPVALTWSELVVARNAVQREIDRKQAQVTRSKRVATSRTIENLTFDADTLAVVAALMQDAIDTHMAKMREHRKAVSA